MRDCQLCPGPVTRPLGFCLYKVHELPQRLSYVINGGKYFVTPEMLLPGYQMAVL